jgi:hypothetical protein
MKPETERSLVNVIEGFAGAFLFFVFVGILENYGYLDPILDWLRMK